MPVGRGTHTFGPGNGTLAVRTGRTGAAAKAGHDLLIHVTGWRATLEVGDDDATSIVLEADPTSLRVLDGTGGVHALGEDDKANIEQTINDDVLEEAAIEFRSTSVLTSANSSRMSVLGELTIVGNTRPIGFDLTIGDDGRISGSAVVKQTGWGITPYSTLFGTLKVVDEVEVVIDAILGGAAERPVAGASDASRPERIEPRSRRLRAPSIGPGVSSFLWALFFFLVIWLGMVALGASGATALLFALAAAFLIFVFVRSQGSGRKG